MKSCLAKLLIEKGVMTEAEAWLGSLSVNR
jgi:hypothetical protein